MDWIAGVERSLVKPLSYFFRAPPVSQYRANQRQDDCPLGL